MFSDSVIPMSTDAPAIRNSHFESHPLSLKASLIKGSLLSRPSPSSIRQPRLVSNPITAHPASTSRDADPPSDQHPGPSSKAVLSIPDRSVTTPLTALSTSILPQSTFTPVPLTNPKKVLSAKRRFSHVEVLHPPDHVKR